MQGDSAIQIPNVQTINILLFPWHFYNTQLWEGVGSQNDKLGEGALKWTLGEGGWNKGSQNNQLGRG
jgi:hypothetical protein